MPTTGTNESYHLDSICGHQRRHIDHTYLVAMTKKIGNRRNQTRKPSELSLGPQLRRTGHSISTADKPLDVLKGAKGNPWDHSNGGYHV